MLTEMIVSFENCNSLCFHTFYCRRVKRCEYGSVEAKILVRLRFKSDASCQKCNLVLTGVSLVRRRLISCVSLFLVIFIMIRFSALLI